MDTTRLKKTIRKLNDDLERTGRIDPELRELLEDLDADLHRLLAATEEVEQERSGLQEQLEMIASRFESQHPQMASMLREIGVALARVGI
jgi:cell division septum initiation protein DivIVA